MMYVMDITTKWEEYLYLVELSYNNEYQELLKMSPFEALYGRRCNVPVNWDKPMDRLIVGPKMLQYMEEQMAKDKHNLKVAQAREKS